MGIERILPQIQGNRTEAVLKKALGRKFWEAFEKCEGTICRYEDNRS
jgi:hypothetical protein